MQFERPWYLQDFESNSGAFPPSPSLIGPRSWAWCLVKWCIITGLYRINNSVLFTVPHKPSISNSHLVAEPCLPCPCQNSRRPSYLPTRSNVFFCKTKESRYLFASEFSPRLKILNSLIVRDESQFTELRCGCWIFSQAGFSVWTHEVGNMGE